MQVEFAGPPAADVVLFLHGGGAAGWSWRYQVQDLQDTYRCVVPDLPGSGRSLDEGPFSFEKAADSVAALARRLGASKIHLVGLSLGGQLGTYLLSRQPELFSSAFLSGVLAREAPGGGCMASAPGRALLRATLAAYWPFRLRDFWLRANMRSYGIPAEFLPEVREETRNLTIDSFLHMILNENLRFRLPDGLERAGLPVLVAVGEKEYGIVHDSARDLVRALPQARGVCVRGVGHNWSLENPRLFNRALRDWLARQPLPVECSPLR